MIMIIMIKLLIIRHTD